MFAVWAPLAIHILNLLLEAALNTAMALYTNSVDFQVIVTW